MAKAKKATKTARRAPRPKPGMDVTAAPKWWLTRSGEIRAFLESLKSKGVEVEEIGRSAAGRPIVAASWGERDMLPGRTCGSLGAAMGGGDAETFYGRGKRERQVILFVGAAHGTEFEGTAAALDFLNILATGKDLRGKRQPRIAAAGRKHRFCVIPIFNVDGRDRYDDHVNWINCDSDYHSMISQGLKKDGERLRWPTSKLLYPVPPGDMEIMGTYFNDDGYNLVYDTPFAGECQPETKALVAYCRRELPDVTILSHSNNGSLVEPPNSYIPQHVKERIAHLAAVVGLRCSREGLPKRGIPQRPGYLAEYQFYQSDGLYHACGTVPLVIEFPCGWQNLPDNFGTIMDIGLAVLDEISIFGTHYPFRPPNPRK